MPRHFPPPRALAWAALLALSAVAAPRSGAAEDPGAVALPPFIVEELAKGPPWRYGEAMGFEVLSRCADGTTRRVVDAHFQLHSLLGEILPPALRLKLSVPPALVLYDEELQPAASQEVIRQMLKTQPATPDADFLAMAGGGFRGRGSVPEATPARRYSFLPNLRLWDRDSMTVFMIVRRDDFDGDRLALTHDYVSFMVKSRMPTLPPWFVQGFLAFYRQVKFDGGRLEVDPLEWISRSQTDALKADPKTAVPVPPLGDFLALRPAPVPAPHAVEPLKVWTAQAELFVRWGLDAEKQSLRPAFWRFVERCAVAAPSEALFRECFGFDFAAAQTQLAAYLTTAVRRGLRFEPARRPKLPAWELRNATDVQIARLKGDMERLEVPYVKNLSAELAPKYLEQARRTLRRAYDRDAREPGLLAVMGLCEVDGGNDAAAHEFLESAARLGALRPRANYGLGRLRLAAARAAPGAADGKLSVNQTAEVLQPLFAARQGEPPLPEVYEAIADTWAATSATPTRGHLAVLDEGVRLFPRRLSLVFRAAELNQRHGHAEVAATYAEIAERLAPASGEERERVVALRRVLGL